MKDQEQCVGYIQLVFFDAQSKEALVMAGAGFVTREEDDAAWANVPEFASFSCFMADRLDADMDIIDDRRVSAEVCEKLTRQPIARLIEHARREAQRVRSEWRTRLAALAAAHAEPGRDAVS